MVGLKTENLSVLEKLETPLKEELKTSLSEEIEKVIKTDAFSKILGRGIVNVWFDEFGNFNWQQAFYNVASFRDPKFPTADVSVELQMLKPTDPRHPNPKGSAIEEFVIVAGGRRYQPVRSKTVAIINAENLHKRLVASLVAERDKELQAIPNFGVF